MRDLAHQYGALFILDEVVTGFRYAPGGCQQLYNLQPDISTFGKALVQSPLAPRPTTMTRAELEAAWDAQAA